MRYVRRLCRYLLDIERSQEIESRFPDVRYHGCGEYYFNFKPLCPFKLCTHWQAILVPMHHVKFLNPITNKCTAYFRWWICNYYLLPGRRRFFRPHPFPYSSLAFFYKLKYSFCVNIHMYRYISYVLRIKALVMADLVQQKRVVCYL